MVGKSHEDLVVWQKAIDFVERLYRVTADLPDSESYGLVKQIRLHQAPTNSPRSALFEINELEQGETAGGFQQRRQA